MSSVLTIAGSDPSGGAGIQQDLRVFQSLSCDGLSAITAITVQDTRGVYSVHPVAADVLQAQIEMIIADTRILDGVKIGMLGSAEQVHAVAAALRRFKPENVILDPVLASTGGVPLLDVAGRAALLRELLPYCDLITPNLQEAAELTGLPEIRDVDGIRQAGRLFQALGARAVLIKGRHLPGAPIDYLFLQGSVKPQEFVGSRIETEHTHGTGCFLSSAITAIRAGFGLLDWRMIIEWAKSHLEDALKQPTFTGRGRGYPDAFAATRQPLDPDFYRRIKAVRGLYVLTDPGLRPDRSTVEIVRAALDGGAGIIQLRDKTLSTPKLIAVATEIKQLCEEAGALFIVNDRVDVALASDADGVHLGPDDMSVLDARRLMPIGKLVGASVGSVEEAIRVEPFVGYLALGAVYGSSTKHDAGDAVGTERIREIKTAMPYLPLVAIGGINSGNIDAVIEAGADAAAVISAVICATDMTEATRELVSHFPVPPLVEE